MAHNAINNPNVASLVSRITAPPSNDPRRSDSDADDEDDLFAELEAEIENDDDARVREQGMAELKREMERVKDMKDSGHGMYMEVKDEKEVMRISAREHLCVIHFFHTNFRRCEIMDKHLATLAPKYFATRFIRVFVENVPWLVERLAIKVLPCVICFKDGVSKDRMVGFEELGNNDSFETATLELRLLQSGIVQKEPQTPFNQTYTTATTSTRQHVRRRKDDGNDSDFDLYD